MGRHDLSFEIAKELEALDIIRTMAPEVVDDPELLLGTVEGQTTLIDILDKLILRDIELKSHIAMNTAQAKLFTERCARLVEKQKTLGAMFEVLLSRIGLSSIPGPFGTIIRKRNADNIEITCEADIVPEFWKPKPDEIDKALLKKTYLETRKRREEAIALARGPYLEQLEKAEALPEGAARTKALAKIMGRLQPLLDEIDADLPLPPGVKLAETSYSAYVKVA